MFRIIQTTNNRTAWIKDANDIKDLADIVIGITGDPLDALKIENIAGWMQWGDKFNSKNYKIECFKEG